MITIADEVANGKIADPFDTRNTELVESQFSYNSIADFTSNIRGIQIAHERSLSGYLVTVNAGLDSKLRAEINAAIAALGQIPQPFRNAILDSANDGKIIAAQEAIRQIQRTLENEVIPLIVSS